VFKLFGIDGSFGKGLSFTRRFYILLAFVPGIALLGVLAFAVYSTSPSFCHSCHIMEPYYKAWLGSKHKNIPCVECHYPPGSPRTLLWKKFQAMSQVVKYVTRTYSSKPFAEIEDSSCLRSGCHSTRLLEGKLITKRGVKFDHRPHLTEKRLGRQLRCVSCHSQLVQGKHIEVTYDTCYICHFRAMHTGTEKGDFSCLRCHDLPKRAFKLGGMTYRHGDFVTKRGIVCSNCHGNVIRGKGEVGKDRCLICHNQPEKLARFKDIPFLHDNHVTRHNIACLHCHREIRHSIAIEAGETTGGNGGTESGPESGLPNAVPSGSGLDCSGCHQGEHGGQQAIYTGKVEKFGVAPLPSPMEDAHVSCQGCHYASHKTSYGARTTSASEEACMKCHGPEFKGLLEKTRDEVASCLKAVEANAGLVRNALGSAALDEKARKQAEAELASATGIIDFVRGAHGVHNIYLASVLLRRANEAILRGGEKVSAKLPDLSSQPLIGGSFCATLCHTQLKVQVPPETVRYKGKTMPHKSHTEQLKCADCHDFAGHRRAPLRQDAQAVCAGCHPQ